MVIIIAFQMNSKVLLNGLFSNQSARNHCKLKTTNNVHLYFNLKESKFYLECSVGTLEAKLPLSALRRRVKWERSEVHLPHREKRWGSQPGWEAHNTMIKPHPQPQKYHDLNRKTVVTPRVVVVVVVVYWSYDRNYRVHMPMWVLFISPMHKQNGTNDAAWKCECAVKAPTLESFY